MRPPSNIELNYVSMRSSIFPRGSANHETRDEKLNLGEWSEATKWRAKRNRIETVSRPSLHSGLGKIQRILSFLTAEESDRCRSFYLL